MNDVLKRVVEKSNSIRARSSIYQHFVSPLCDLESDYEDLTQSPDRNVIHQQQKK
jgi:hypothetical protein